MMRRLLLALAVACATAFGVKAAGPLDDYLMFETNGDDCYADGSPLWEGECYALVWRNGDAASREDGLFNADGTVVDSKTTKILAVFPSAMQTNYEDSVYAVARRSWTMISSMDMSRWENQGGVMSVFVFDTRKWNSESQTWQLSECVVEDKSVAAIRRYALVTDLEDIRTKQETGLGIFQWDTEHYGETFVTDPDGDLTMIGDMREFYSGTTNRTVGVSDELVVSFDARGGTPVPATMRMAGSACGELPVATGGSIGYAFDGWYTKPEGGDKVSPDTEVTEDVTFYAHWAPIKYTVRFDANGGEETMDPQTMTYDKEEALSSNLFRRAGYAFAGWADGEDAVVTKYADGEVVSNLTAEAGGTVTLFAVWTAGDNTVTFDAAGGTPSEESRTVKTDEEVGELPAAERTGYALAGWFTAREGGEKISEDEKVTSNVTYYAHWTPNEYSVDFNGREGVGDMPSQPMTYDEEVALYSNLFHRVGYTFLGWTDDEAELEEVLYADGVVVSNLTDMAGGTFDLYAVWQANAYAVRFNANGGEGTMAAQDFVYDRPQALSACAFTREGYGFAGWADGEDAVVTKYANGEVVSNLTDEADGTVSLFAVWTAGANTVTFDAVGGTPSEASRTVETDAKVGALPTADRTGYALAGWFTAREGGDEVTDKTVVTEDVTYYAHWTPNAYSVVFDANGGEGEMSAQAMTYDKEEALSRNLFRRAGYTFAGWAGGKGAVVATYADGATVSNLTAEANGKVTLFAVWSAADNTVTFDAVGGTPSEASRTVKTDAQVGALPTAARPGYALAGWFTAREGGDEVTAETVVTEDVTYYAHWTPNEYSVDFNGRGGDGEMPAQPMTYDEAEALYGNLFHRVGYTFLGWTDDEAELMEVLYADGVVVSNLTDEADGTVDLYAVWQANVYTVRFNANGGKGTMKQQTFRYDVPQRLAPNAFERTGYVLDGWATSADGPVVCADQERVLNLTDEADGDVELFAVWRTGQVWDGTVENDWLELSCRQDVVTLELGEEVVTDADHYFSANSGSEATLKVSGLPAGVKFDAKTGTMSGKATKAGVFYVTVAASNKSKYVQTRVMVMKVGGAEPDDRDEIGLNRAALSSLVVGTDLPSGLVTIPSGASASGLPKGLKVVKAGAVDATGAVCDSIEGVPTKGGKYTVKVTAKNPARTALLTVIVADPGSKYVAVAAEGDGTATKSGVYAAGSTLKLAAKPASKGSVFVGWKDEKGDRVLADGADARATTLSTVVGAATSAHFTACFAPALKDAETGVDVVPVAEAWTFDEQEGPSEFLFRIDSLSLPKVSVKPIPSGFAFNGAKDIVIGADGEQYYRLVVKDAGKTKPGVYDLAFGVGNASVKQAFVKSLTLVVKNRRSGLYDLDYENPYQVSLGVNDASKYPAFAAPAGAKVSVSGLPSGLKYKDGKITGVATKTGAFTVTITTSTAAGKAVDTVFMSVDALPASLVGTFNGVATNDDVLATEKLTLTATDKGKITAKVGALSLTATGWDSLADGCARVRLEKAADVLDVCVNAGAWDALQVSGLYAGATEAFGLRAQRNPFGKAGKDYENPEAHELAVRLSRLGEKGKVPLSAAPDEKAAGVWNLSSRGEGAAQLTVQVKETGVVSLSGKLDKAHAASGSSVLTVDGELVTADFVLGKGEKKTVVRLVFGPDASGEIVISGTAWTQPAE